MPSVCGSSLLVRPELERPENTGHWLSPSLLRYGLVIVDFGWLYINWFKLSRFVYKIIVSGLVVDQCDGVGVGPATQTVIFFLSLITSIEFPDKYVPLVSNNNNLCMHFVQRKLNGISNQ